MALLNKMALITLALASLNANASLVTANGNNHTLSSAQSLNGHFTQEYNAEITDSTAVAHASATGTGQNAWDYYSFTLTSAANVLFDIDHAMPALDSWLNIYNSVGDRLAYNDDGGVGDAGSIHGYDSYLSYNFSEAGTYTVGVGRYSNSPLVGGQGYTLNVSTVAAVPEPETYALMAVGLLGLAAARRRKQVAA